MNNLPIPPLILPSNVFYFRGNYKQPQVKNVWFSDNMFLQSGYLLLKMVDGILLPWPNNVFMNYWNSMFLIYSLFSAIFGNIVLLQCFLASRTMLTPIFGNRLSICKYEFWLTYKFELKIELGMEFVLTAGS